MGDTGTEMLLPLAIAGASGVGKGTIIKKLLTEMPGVFGLSVSHTTRAPRPGELDGVHYHFVTQDQMHAKIAAGDFAEYAEVHGNHYGTSFESVRDVGNQGLVCALDIDIQGVDALKKSSLAPWSTFVTVPSLTDLEERLRGRGTETEETLRTRLNNASQEIEWGLVPGRFDLIVANNDFGVTPCLEITRTMAKDWYIGTDIAAKLQAACGDEWNSL